jgi:hypothetical protein
LFAVPPSPKGSVGSFTPLLWHPLHQRSGFVEPALRSTVLKAAAQREGARQVAATAVVNGRYKLEERLARWLYQSLFGHSRVSA